MTKLTLAIALAVCVAGGGSLAAEPAAPNTYIVHGLVSDLPGTADHLDPNLINPWGNGFGPGPFWIGNNGTGTATLYDGFGNIIPLVVKIPAAGGAGGTPGPVTGVVFNAFNSNTGAFDLAAGKPAIFLFCSEDGVISGWNSSVDATNAHILADRSATGASYKGCALGGTAAAPLLFAANFRGGKVDVFDGSLNLVNGNAFVDSAVPATFSPFNVQVLSGKVYVAYALPNTARDNDVAGSGNGYVATFDMSGTLLNTLISQGPLNSPWGFAIAPSTFGAFGGSLLVGNFGDGKINAFDPVTGAFRGFLMDSAGNPIGIPGLWSINFGSGARNEDKGTLYFTAGIGGGPNHDEIEKHGLLGSIQAPASFDTTSVLNGASFVAGPIAPNTWTSIKGSGLSATLGQWQVTGATLPTTMNGVTVTVNGEPAPLSYISNGQINFLVPADIQPGTPAKIVVNNNGLLSAAVSVPVNTIAPAFFVIGSANGHDYIAATHADNSVIGPAGLIKNLTTTGAKPGETIVLYGAGFGPTTPAIPNGQTITTALQLPVTPTVVIDGFPAQVKFAGLTGAGLYQINVVVPSGVATGDVLVVALLANGETQANAYITIAAP